MSPLEGLSLLVGACWSEQAGWLRESSVCEKSRIGFSAEPGDGSEDCPEAWLSVREVREGIIIIIIFLKRHTDTHTKKTSRIKLVTSVPFSPGRGGKKVGYNRTLFFLSRHYKNSSHSCMGCRAYKTIVALQQAVRCKLFKERMAKLEGGEGREKSGNEKSPGACSPRWCFRQTVNHTEGAITCSPSPWS